MPKINLKDKINDNELDLSMSDIQDVPVKDIAAFKRVTCVDLSNNKITTLTIDFAPLLSRLVKLDLSQNQLHALPDNFGELKNLRELDLYNNKLQHLPLSLGQCKFLRWLDLKNNPLVPAIGDVAGPCLDAKQCQTCAKKIVPFLNNMQIQIDQECERRNAQRKRDFELREAQQMQQKKEQQKNLKKAAKAEKKQKDGNGEVNQISSKNKKTQYNTQNGKSQQDVSITTKKSFISQVLIILAVTAFLSALLSIWLVKYDQPKYLIVQQYVVDIWSSIKQMVPPTLSEKLSEASINLYLISQSLFSNVQTVFNTTAVDMNKAYEYYKMYFNEEYINRIMKALYETYVHLVKLLVDFTNNFIKELPEIIEVIQKRLLG